MNTQGIMQRAGKYVLFIILLLAACTSSPKKNASQEEVSSPDDIPAQTEQEKEPKVHVVEIKEMKFQPSEIKVHKGEKVLWVNRDITDHDVTEQNSKAWASSPLHAGESWGMVVTESADYYCNLHQVMKGKIIVE